MGWDLAMTDLFANLTPAPRAKHIPDHNAGTSNGAAIGHITNARELGLTRSATAQALRDRQANGELAGVSNRIVTMNLDFGR